MPLMQGYIKNGDGGGSGKPNLSETIFMNRLRGGALVGSLGGSVIQARVV